MKPNSKLPVLHYDIETQYAQGYFFDRKNEVSVDNIIKPSSIISIAWRWEGEKRAKVMTIADFPENLANDPYDDSALLEAFRPQLEKAEYLVGHYITGFDNKVLAWRYYVNRMKPMPVCTVVDTYYQAAGKFKNMSNRLSSLGLARGLGGKIATNAELWRQCAQGNVKAILQMGKYNRRDTDLLFDLHYDMAPYVTSKLNRRLHEVGDQNVCPACGGSHLQKRGTYSTGKTLQRRMECQGCGKWFTVRLKKGAAHA